MKNMKSKKVKVDSKTIGNFDFMPNGEAGKIKLSHDQFEQWLASKPWDDEIKSDHRNEFSGSIKFTKKRQIKYPSKTRQ